MFSTEETWKAGCTRTQNVEFIFELALHKTTQPVNGECLLGLHSVSTLQYAAHDAHIFAYIFLVF